MLMVVLLLQAAGLHLDVDFIEVLVLQRLQRSNLRHPHNQNKNK
jgi:hypothetical protein